MDETSTTNTYTKSKRGRKKKSNQVESPIVQEIIQTSEELSIQKSTSEKQIIFQKKN